MLTEARARLAARQGDLVRALVAQGPLPAGFDAERVRACARALVNKRRQALARAWPKLIAAVGDDYVERFNEYADRHPLPASANALKDGRAFLDWLEAQAPLRDEARAEAARFDLRFRATPLGLRPRRGLGCKFAKLSEAKVLLIGVRLPFLGERWWRMPIGRD